MTLLIVKFDNGGPKRFQKLDILERFRKFEDKKYLSYTSGTYIFLIRDEQRTEAGNKWGKNWWNVWSPSIWFISGRIFISKAGEGIIEKKILRKVERAVILLHYPATRESYNFLKVFSDGNIMTAHIFRFQFLKTDFYT